MKLTRNSKHVFFVRPPKHKHHQSRNGFSEKGLTVFVYFCDSL